MPGMPWPEDSRAAADLYDNPTLAGFRLPGICIVDVDGGLELDKGKAGNKHKANIKVKGQLPREVTIDWRVWSETFGDTADWELMQEILEFIEPQAGKKDIPPLVIFSAQTFARGVDSVLIEKIKGPKFSNGFMAVSLKCIESEPAVAGKGIGSAGTPKAGAPGSQWEQAPSFVGPGGIPSEEGQVETTLTKSKPSKSNAGP